MSKPSFESIMEKLREAETIFYGDFSCEGCPEDCPLKAVGGWDLCEIIELAGPLKDLREKGIIA